MWINNQLTPLVAIVVTLLCGHIRALDVANKVVSNVVQILPKDGMLRENTPVNNMEKDLKTDATVTHTSEPAPEFYRGVSATDPLRDRAYDRYGTGSDYSQKGSWLSLDKESLYKNPYLANAYQKLTNGGSSSLPSVSSLTSPNASYKDRYDQYNHPSSNDYLNNKYGSSNYGSYSSGIGAPYGPAQSLDYNHYGGSSSGYDNGYGSRPSYGLNSILGDSGYGGYGGVGGGHYNKFGQGGGDYLSSKFGKSSILPLAGAALLGVAATLVANPLLLNFGLGVGKRRRRSIQANENLRAKYQGQELVYRGYRV